MASILPTKAAHTGAFGKLARKLFQLGCRTPSPDTRYLTFANAEENQQGCVMTREVYQGWYKIPIGKIGQRQIVLHRLVKTVSFQLERVRNIPNVSCANWLRESSACIRWCVRLNAVVTSREAFLTISSCVNFSFVGFRLSTLSDLERSNSRSLRRAISEFRFACNCALRKSPRVL